ncbi:MAG: RNA polymerase subunit sigma [Nitrospinae bacterium RIFCSPLOWO2_12_39_16]|nr:MAG: RNA polymerase subunit sigma [Nitrospinae bacterium RIFCSPLOWO2_12_39_16]
MTTSRKEDYYEFDPLWAYLKDISSIKPLSGKEEKILAAKGDQKSLNELVKRNLKYVVSVANRYKGCGLSLSDLINEGNIGMIEAAKRFDPQKGVKFITYAVWWIRQSILHALAEQAGSVRLPIKQAGLLYKISAKYRELFLSLKREPTSEDVAKVLNISLEDVESVMRVYRFHLSLDTPLKENEDTSYLDMLASSTEHPVDEDILLLSLKKEIEGLLSELSSREKRVLKMRFGFGGEPMTLEEIGKKIGLSRERVRQIEKRAKSKLFSKAKTNDVKDYLN